MLRPRSGLPAAALAAAALLACPGRDPVDETTAATATEGDPSGDTDTNPTDSATDPTLTGAPTTGDPPFAPEVAIDFNRDVDILFVIDNSGSMAEEQQRLAQNLAGFVAALEAPDVAANYRIGFTTTDAGNPRCPAAVTTPEDGDLVLVSCAERVQAGEFMTPDGDFSAACTDQCAFGPGDLTILPTATEYDPQARPRSWLERNAGVINVSGTDSMADAVRCFAPQGVTGCGFESHLEAMYKALAKAQLQDSLPNFGFVRASAALSIVIVSDEADCSYDPDAAEIFVDNKVFWWSPDDPAPTSSLCWDAGVACDGNSPVYSDCRAENFDLEGNPGVADDQAVLQPISKYIGFVADIESTKQQYTASREVLVALIAGVPIGYESFDAEITYEDSPDPDYMSRFGIGPGCVVGPANAPTATAVPPVREREFAEAFVESEGRNLYSICDDDYSAAIAAIADRIREQLEPACFSHCAADTDPQDPALQPSCQLYEENLGEGIRVPIAPCVAGEDPMGQPAWLPPAGESLCWANLVDDGSDAKATPGALDDMSQACVDQGYNLEFTIVRTAPAPAGITYSATCEHSLDKQADCPNL